MHQWDVFINDMKYEIVFEGRKVSGKVKLRINGYSKEYATVFVDDVGTLCPFDIGGNEFILKLMDDQPMGLIQNGVYVETGLPMEQEAVDGYRSALQPRVPLADKSKAKMTSFLTFVILTFVNLFLIVIDSSISFPFSAIVPQILFGLGWYPLEYPLLVSQPVLLFIAVICALVYLILYYLSLKKNWPILTTIILIALDTVVLIYLSIGDFTHNIIDIAFHAWVLWSIIQLYRIRIRIKKEAV